MPLSRTDMDRKIDAHFDYEARDDVEGVLSTLADDVIHEIIGAPGGAIQGRDNARPVYESLFADLADGQVTPIRRLYGDNFLIDYSNWRGTAAGRPFGLDGRGRPLEFRLLHVVEFTEDGQIQSEAVWTDLAAMIRQLPQN